MAKHKKVVCVCVGGSGRELGAHREPSRSISDGLLWAPNQPTSDFEWHFAILRTKFTILFRQKG